MTAGLLLDVLTFTTLLFTNSFDDTNPVKISYFFIFPILWGVSNAIINTQLNAVIGLIFTDQKNQAFSLYRVFLSLGMIILLVLQNLICMTSKIYLVFSFITVSLLGYLVLEFCFIKQK